MSFNGDNSYTTHTSSYNIAIPVSKNDLNCSSAYLNKPLEVMFSTYRKKVWMPYRVSKMFDLRNMSA